MENQKSAGEHEWEHGQGKNAVAPPAAPLQIGRGPGEISEDVQIREVGPDDEGTAGECGSLA
jgi:hypothetical protein